MAFNLDFLRRLLSKNSDPVDTMSLEVAVKKGILTEEEKLRIEQHRITEKLEELAKSKKQK